MFMGEFSHTIDSKGRLILPSKFREELGQNFIITRGLESCLTVYTLDEWAKFANNIQKHSNEKRNVRNVKRYYFGSATEGECDRQGRVLIPSNLREHAKLIKDAVIIGTANVIEIWSRSLWEQHDEEIKPEIESIAESLDDSIYIDV